MGKFIKSFDEVVNSLSRIHEKYKNTDSKEEHIDACIACAEACKACAEACQEMDGMENCVKLCNDCAAICDAYITLLESESTFCDEVCNVFVNICEACQVECKLHEDCEDCEECVECAEACKACIVTCEGCNAEGKELPLDVEEEIKEEEEDEKEESEEEEEAVTEKKKNADAAIRNRGAVVFSANSPKVKDDKDHFPINNASQARNALARASQYSKKPEWYTGTLNELVSRVQKEVKANYPDIKVTDKSKNPGKG